jgi:hypothetical protein
MKRKESGTALLAIRLPLREMCPAEYQAGVAQMGIAKGYLEKSENECGSHRSEGIASIDQTFSGVRRSPRSTPGKCNPATRTNPRHDERRHWQAFETGYQPADGRSFDRVQSALWQNSPGWQIMVG